MRVSAAEVLVPEVVQAQPSSLNALTQIFDRAVIELDRTKMGVERLKNVSFRDPNELFWEIRRIQKKLDAISDVLNEASTIQEAWDEHEFQQEQAAWQRQKR